MDRRDEDRAAGGRLFGDAGDGMRWQLRNDRPSWHREDCDCSLCWQKVRP